MANRVDGIFISISQETFDNQLFDHIKNAIDRSVPIIFIDRKFEVAKSKAVVVDDYHGAYMATQHLIEVGCKRIAHLKGPTGMTVSEQRFKGYRDCLQNNNFNYDQSIICNTNFEVESAIEPTKYLLDLPLKPDAIFGVNDHVCIGAMHVIRERNLHIPKDIAIVGFDDSPIAQYFSPPLSSVVRKSRQIGLEASQLFLNQFLQKSAPFQAENIVLASELIIRDSSKK